MEHSLPYSHLWKRFPLFLLRMKHILPSPCIIISHELSGNRDSVKWFDKGSSEMWLMGSISLFVSSYFPNSNVSQLSNLKSHINNEHKSKHRCSSTVVVQSKGCRFTAIFCQYSEDTKVTNLPFIF
jgi:hypothetical protein